MTVTPAGPEWDVIPRRGQSRTDAEREQWARDMQVHDEERGDPREARADRSER